MSTEQFQRGFDEGLNMETLPEDDEIFGQRHNSNKLGVLMAFAHREGLAAGPLNAANYAGYRAFELADQYQESLKDALRFVEATYGEEGVEGFEEAKASAGN